MAMTAALPPGFRCCSSSSSPSLSPSMRSPRHHCLSLPAAKSATSFKRLHRGLPAQIMQLRHHQATTLASQQPNSSAGDDNSEQQMISSVDGSAADGRVFSESLEDTVLQSIDSAGGIRELDESRGFKIEESATVSSMTADESVSSLGPTLKSNHIVAIASVAAAVSLFFVNRGIGSGPTLSELAASALPYEEALRNGKPTVIEFYADWCEICREMARDVYSVEQEYKDQVNFVMLNVDNNKWEAELDEFGVEGIPHFAFLDSKGNEEGNVVGRLPKQYFLENVNALARGGVKLPHSKVLGQFSSAESRQAPPVLEPRSHGR